MRSTCCLGLILILAGSCFAQETSSKPKFINSATVEHRGSSTTVTANDPRPLWQAVKAIREEYGWVIDFEDPPYFGAYDLVDSTDPKWRASHPNEKGVWRIGGGAFSSDFAEAATTTPSPLQMESLLKKIVSDYNASGNPGKFTIRKESQDRYSVIGVSRRNAEGKDQIVSSILDTPISIPVQKRTAVETLYLILSTLSATSGVKVLPFMVSTNAMPANEIAIGGNEVPARTLLLETLRQANTKRTLMWDLFFDPDPNTNAYLLNIEVAARNTPGPSAQPTTKPLAHTE